MLSRSKIAILALIGAFTMGFALAPVSASPAGNHAYSPKSGHGSYRAKSGRKGGYKRSRQRHRSKARRKHVRAVSARSRHWRPGPSRSVPAPRYRWKYKNSRHNRRYGPPLRHYRHKHSHRRSYGGGNELAAGLIGVAIGAIIAGQNGYGQDGPPQGRPPQDRPPEVLNRVATGAVIGGEIGRSMNWDDQDRASNVLETSRTGHAVKWQDADTGNLYTMTPTRTYRNARGQDCRDYTIWGWVDGYEENLDGTACRSAAGGWQLPA